jgi:imidazolonepropionase-like amidohydrolase
LRAQEAFVFKKISTIMNKLTQSIFFLFLTVFSLHAQSIKVLVPDRVFDGEQVHEGWAVRVEGNTIAAVGPAREILEGYRGVPTELPGTTLMPGMIEGHSHILLHPYNEVSWNDQVLKESQAERVIRAANHAKANLMAGFTTIRDLGSEGAGYADVGVKQSIEKGIIPGPRMLVAGPAIVATGSYGPKGFAPHVKVPLGANEADGIDALIREVRRQIGGGADIIKVYADYRWGPNGEAMPTFTQQELEIIVDVASSSGRPVVAHAATAEGMRRAAMAGVQTIEHGDGGTPEVFKLMADRGVALCPTLAAGDAILQYNGWKKGEEADPPRIVQKKKSFKQALEAGVTIVAGGDVGVFSHGTNVRELEMMVEYGMNVMDVLKSVTSGNANALKLEGMGYLKKGYLADIIAVEGMPEEDIKALRKVTMVMKNGEVYE